MPKTPIQDIDIIDTKRGTMCWYSLGKCPKCGTTALGFGISKKFCILDAKMRHQHKPDCKFSEFKVISFNFNEKPTKEI